MMNEELRDIEILENLVIAMREGASDEKHMALSSIEKMIARKKAIVSEFDAYIDKLAEGYGY